MFVKAADEAGGKLGSNMLGDVAVTAAAKRRLRESVLNAKKAQLMKWVVESDANRPRVKYTKIISSVAFEGLRRDYMRMCQGYNGGLHIVYDKQGTGKSYALQAIARAKSIVQPDRFLVINIAGDHRTCQDLYKAIKDRVLGPAEDFDLTPDEVAMSSNMVCVATTMEMKILCERHLIIVAFR